jgi:hypothetical protein
VCVYKIENFRTLSAPSEIASLREAISSSAAFEKKKFLRKKKVLVGGKFLVKDFGIFLPKGGTLFGPKFCT